MTLTKTSVTLKTQILLQCLGLILTSSSPNLSKACLDISSPQLLLLLSKPKDDVETSPFNPLKTVLSIVKFLNVYTRVFTDKWIERKYYLLTGRDTLPGGTHQPGRPDQEARRRTRQQWAPCQIHLPSLLTPLGATHVWNQILQPKKPKPNKKNPTNKKHCPALTGVSQVRNLESIQPSCEAVLGRKAIHKKASQFMDS